MKNGDRLWDFSFPSSLGTDTHWTPRGVRTLEVSSLTLPTTQGVWVGSSANRCRETARPPVGHDLTDRGRDDEVPLRSTGRDTVSNGTLCPRRRCTSTGLTRNKKGKPSVSCRHGEEGVRSGTLTKTFLNTIQTNIHIYENI